MSGKNVAVMTTCDAGIDITAGKVYEARIVFGNLVEFTDDSGYKIKTGVGGLSAHLNCQGQFDLVDIVDENVYGTRYRVRG